MGIFQNNFNFFQGNGQYTWIDGWMSFYSNFETSPNTGKIH